jgi:hypothetical protein
MTVLPLKSESLIGDLRVPFLSAPGAVKSGATMPVSGPVTAGGVEPLTAAVGGFCADATEAKAAKAARETRLFDIFVGSEENVNLTDQSTEDRAVLSLDRAVER